MTNYKIKTLNKNNSYIKHKNYLPTQKTLTNQNKINFGSNQKTPKNNDNQKSSIIKKFSIYSIIIIPLILGTNFILKKCKYSKKALNDLNINININKNKTNTDTKITTEFKIKEKTTLKEDKILEISPKNTEVKDKTKLLQTEKLKEKLDLKLNKFSKNIHNLSRTELANIKYNLIKRNGKIAQLEKEATTNPLSNTEKLKLNYYKSKLNLITEREKEIEKKLQYFHPADTVSKTSAIPQHHNVMGYNDDIRFAIDNRANNFKNLDKSEIKEILSTEKLIKEIDLEYSKLPPLEHKCIVYKGLAENPVFEEYNKAFKIINNAKIGDIVIPDNGYSYTAFNRSIAEHWGGPGARAIKNDKKTNRVMMYEIHIPKGAKVSRCLEHQGEILIPHGAEYKILNKRIEKNGDIEVTLEYLPPKNNKIS